jgi:hypothetical protein
MLAARKEDFRGPAPINGRLEITLMLFEQIDQAVDRTADLRILITK